MRPVSHMSAQSLSNTISTGAHRLTWLGCVAWAKLHPNQFRTNILTKQLVHAIADQQADVNATYSCATTRVAEAHPARPAGQHVISML